MDNVIRTGYVDTRTDRSVKCAKDWTKMHYILHGGMVNSLPRLTFANTIDSPHGTVYFEDIYDIKPSSDKCEFTYRRSDVVIVHVRLPTPEECYQWRTDMINIKSGHHRKLEAMNINQQDPMYTNVEEVTTEENCMYQSFTKSDIFRVSINPTDASERCNLRGLFDLLVGTQNMTLADHTTGEYLYTWPYSYLRRSGGNNMTFMFEAGRKCDSGDGVFKFRLSTAKKLTEKVQENTKQLNRKKGLSSTPTLPPSMTSSFDHTTPPGTPMTPTSKTAPFPGEQCREVIDNNNNESIMKKIKLFEKQGNVAQPMLTGQSKIVNRSLDSVDASVMPCYGTSKNDDSNYAMAGNTTAEHPVQQQSHGVQPRMSAYEIAKAKFPPNNYPPADYQEPTAAKELDLLYNRIPTRVCPLPSKVGPDYALYDITQLPRSASRDDEEYCEVARSASRDDEYCEVVALASSNQPSTKAQRGRPNIGALCREISDLGSSSAGEPSTSADEEYDVLNLRGEPTVAQRTLSDPTVKRIRQPHVQPDANVYSRISNP